MLHLRPTEPADERFLIALYADVRSDAAIASGRLDRLLQEQFYTESAQLRAGFLESTDHVIEIGGRDVGRCWVHDDGSALRILDIAVLRAYQGCGIATAVIAQLAVTRPVWIAVWADEHLARLLHERLGFHEVDARGSFLHLERPAAA